MNQHELTLIERRILGIARLCAREYAESLDHPFPVERLCSRMPGTSRAVVGKALEMLCRRGYLWVTPCQGVARQMAQGELADVWVGIEQTAHAA